MRCDVPDRDVPDRDVDSLLALLLDPGLDLAARDFSAPRPSLRADLLAATEPGITSRSLAGFRARFARLFGLGSDEAERVLMRVQDPAAWVRFKTLRVCTFSPGPERAGACARLVRIAPGTPFPAHCHKGREITLMLSGAARDEDSGTVHLPGDLLAKEAGSTHRISILPPEECIFAVLIDGEEPLFY